MTKIKAGEPAILEYLNLKTFSEVSIIELDKKYSIDEVAELMGVSVQQVEYIIENKFLKSSDQSIIGLHLVTYMNEKVE